jgi:ABC-2 type transport system permease protein
MNFGRMYIDEITGFIRSRIIHVLLVGLPLLTLFLRLIRPDTEGVPLLLFVSIVLASVGGTISAVLLGTTVANERSRGVYDLFLIRPVTRPVLLLSKYFASLTVLLGAVLASMALALVVDAVMGTYSPGVLQSAAESVILSVAGMAVACSVGLLFGTIFDSVAVTAVLSVYLGNQLSAVIILPPLFVEGIEPLSFAPVAGIAVPAIILFIAIKVFSRKTL